MDSVPVHVMEPIFSSVIKEMGHVKQCLELLERLSFAGSNSGHESSRKPPRNEVAFVLFGKSPIHLGWINVVTLKWNKRRKKRT